MSSPIPKKTITVDTLVVGAGLAGLFTAALRAHSGKKVLVVEASDAIGGRWSPEKRNGYQLGAGLAFSDPAVWSQVYSALDMPSQMVEIENGKSVLYGTKGWQEPSDLPEWENYFSQHITAMPRGGFAGFMDELLKSDRFQIMLESPITELHVEGGRAHQAMIGVDTMVQFDECMWAADAKTLIEVLRGAEVPEQGTARIAWMKQYIATSPSPGVVLEFAHSARVSDFSETIVLPLPLSDGEAERRYVVGSFISNRDASLAPEGKQISSWIFQLPEDIVEDNHEIMKRIRSARRAIEKCFEGFEKSIVFERVQVLPRTVTPLKKKRKTEVSMFSNLYPVADWSAPKGGHFEGLVEKIFESPLAPT